MLKGLTIRDMLIIDHLELQFEAGLNVLTGETGAGKSILLDCLGFVLGWRGRAELVRKGADQGEVTAWFDLPKDHPAHQVLEEAGLPVSDELILRRINSNEGRKTAWINDRRVSGEVLRTLSQHLVELHGQHDDRGLLDAKGHRPLLDAFGAYGPQLDQTAKAWASLSAAQKSVAKTEAELEALHAEEDFLRHAVAELSALDPRPGEEAELDARRRMMQSAARIREDVAKAQAALGREGAEGLIADASRWLDGALETAGPHLQAPIAALERVMVEVQDAQSGIDACLQALDFNPEELEITEERLFAMRGLARKHQVPVEELGAFCTTLSARLAALDNSTQTLDQLHAALTAAQSGYQTASAELHQARQAAADKLDAAMAAELPPLKLERAVFETQVSPGAEGPAGADQVAFCVATNPGAPSGPLAKIASGGELSRFMLALKMCLSIGRSQATMMFDEIDRGVGGATADAVGRRLSRLAAEGQILVVTHSPQVAACGQVHFQVTKEQTADQTRSVVRALDAGERVDEIARMISGTQVTPEAKAAAKALLAGS